VGVVGFFKLMPYIEDDIYRVLLNNSAVCIGAFVALIIISIIWIKFLYPKRRLIFSQADNSIHIIQNFSGKVDERFLFEEIDRIFVRVVNLKNVSFMHFGSKATADYNIFIPILQFKNKTSSGNDEYPCFVFDNYDGQELANRTAQIMGSCSNVQSFGIDSMGETQLPLLPNILRKNNADLLALENPVTGIQAIAGKILLAIIVLGLGYIVYALVGG
jgi:hypothetical protein